VKFNFGSFLVKDSKLILLATLHGKMAVQRIYENC